MIELKILAALILSTSTDTSNYNDSGVGGWGVGCAFSLTAELVGSLRENWGIAAQSVVNLGAGTGVGC